MNHYDWPLKLRVLYDKSLDYSGRGGREAESFLTSEERSELGAIGIAPIHLFDFADDFLKYGDPQWETFLLVASARRDYFLYELGGKPAASQLREEDLPPKKEALEGYVWLPRIVRKAQSFLEGTLPTEIMYGCGGDRNFLREHDLHMGEFLRMVWASHGNASKLLRFLKKP